MKRSINILIVDDEEALRDIVAFELEYSDLEYNQLIKASGGYEALDIVKTQDIDLIITDMQMPEGTGLDLLMGVKNLGKNIPSIVISGFAKNEQLEQLDNIQFFSKPCEYEKLHSYIKELFKGVA